MPLIDYEKIPFKEKRSTGEHVLENAFYLPKTREESSWYSGYSANDFFGLEIERITPLDAEEMMAVDW